MTNTPTSTRLAYTTALYDTYNGLRRTGYTADGAMKVLAMLGASAKDVLDTSATYEQADRPEQDGK